MSQTFSFAAIMSLVTGSNLADDNFIEASKLARFLFDKEQHGHTALIKAQGILARQFPGLSGKEMRSHEDQLIMLLETSEGKINPKIVIAEWLLQQASRLGLDPDVPVEVDEP